VVVERHPGVDLDDAGAVEVQLDDDVGLFGPALDAGAPIGAAHDG